MKVAVTVTARNVSLVVDLSVTDQSAGAVYCMALSGGLQPLSIGAILNSGSPKHYVSRKISPVVVIIGLIALTSYRAFCYVQTADGSGTDIADVVSSAVTFQTSCCHGITFTNTPASVYGNISTYGTTSSSAYLFSYALDFAPSEGFVTVTPVLTNSDGSAMTYVVSANPPSSTFFSSYSPSKLTGYFYLTAAADVTKTFLVSLALTGRDRLSFAAMSTTTTVLGAKAALPAPSLISCIFDVSGAYVVITFNTPTDEAGITALTWQCDKLFTFRSAKSTVCSWTSLTTVRGTFDGSALSLLQPGDTLAVLGGLLRSACMGTSCSSNAYLEVSDESDRSQFRLKSPSSDRMALSSSAAHVIVQAPTVSVVPTIVVGAPTQLGACNNLSVDLSASTGSGGRRWSSVTFSVAATNGISSAIASYLTNSFNNISNIAVIPRSMLLSATYSITATVTNFFGNSASRSSTVQVLGDPNLPSVTILGPGYRSIKALSPLSLQGAAVLSSCAISYALVYKWTLFDFLGQPLLSNSTNRDPRQYTAPPHFFSPGSTYSIVLTVTATSSSSIKAILSSGYTSTQLYIPHGVVVAAVRYGYSRQVSVDSVLLLDASLSYDEDSVNVGNLRFLWSCTVLSPSPSQSRVGDTSSPCNFTSALAISSSSSVFRLPSNSMMLNSKYSFDVTVTSQDGRSASQVVLVTAIAPGSPVLTLSYSRNRFNSDQPLVLSALLSSNYSTRATWTALSFSSPVPLTLAYTDTSRVFSAQELKSPINYPLAIGAFAFIGGRSYTFRLSASPVNYPTLVAVTEVTLTANSPPTGGYLVVTPQKGFALSTLFDMATAGWSDDISSLPLSYNFAYELAVSTLIPPLFLTVTTLLPHTQSALPPGLLGGKTRKDNMTICFAILYAVMSCSVLFCPIFSFFPP